MIICIAVNASFTQLQYDVEESDQFITICVVITGEFGTTLSVVVSATSMTAIVDSDFAFTNETLSFAPMQMSRCFNVTVTDEQVVEANENFYINMNSDSRAVNVVTSSTIVVIHDSSMINFMFDREEYFAAEGESELICVFPVEDLNRLVEVSVNLDTRGRTTYRFSARVFLLVMTYMYLLMFQSICLFFKLFCFKIAIAEL